MLGKGRKGFIKQIGASWHSGSGVLLVGVLCGLSAPTDTLHPKGHPKELTSGIHPGAKFGTKLCKAIQGLRPSTDEGIFSDDKAAVGADPGVGASHKS